MDIKLTVTATMRNIVIVCQLLFLVAHPRCMHYNGLSFEVISLRAPEGQRGLRSV